MGQISVEKSSLPGSDLSGNQHEQSEAVAAAIVAFFCGLR
jgi:hypothetical protein